MFGFQIFYGGILYAFRAANRRIPLKRYAKLGVKIRLYIIKITEYTEVFPKTEVLGKPLLYL
jgi:hypothetical protein